MNNPCIRALGLAVFSLLASSAADAGIQLNVDLNPFGWGPAPPPIVYQPPRYYAPPPVVYYGHGHWGDRDWRRHERYHARGHDRPDHDDGGHRH